MEEKPNISEVIVVEGRDDIAAVKNAVNATIIATHGFGIKKSTWKQIKNAYDTRGIIIFTDPDFAGNQIRKRIKTMCPEAKEAFLAKVEATKAGDIGIENASPEAIRKALEKVHYTSVIFKTTFTVKDMVENGLSGGQDSRQRREILGNKLGIGYANAQSFLKKLNEYNISREEFMKKIEEI